MSAQDGLDGRSLEAKETQLKLFAIKGVVELGGFCVYVGGDRDKITYPTEKGYDFDADVFWRN